MGDRHAERKKRNRRKRAAASSAAPPGCSSKRERSRAKRESAARMRDRHTDPDYERLLAEAEANGWLVIRDEGYYKCLCPCDEKNWVSVPLTPSSQRTLMNKRKDFERSACWSKGANR